jgi:hypothetical protein
MTDQLLQLVIEYARFDLLLMTYLNGDYLALDVDMKTPWPPENLYADVPLEELNNDRPTASTRY